MDPTDLDFEPEPPLWEQWAARNAELPDGERLQKVLARIGWGSRRVCEDLISEGRVTVNGEVAVLGRRVDPDRDLVEVDGAPVGVKPGLVHYLVNKPVGVVTTAKDPQGRPTVLDLVPDEPRVFPVGRLDRDTGGLLLLTNDGELAHRLMHPRHGVDKEYLVEVDGGAVAPGGVRQLREGIVLDDGPTAPAKVSQPDPGILRITIHEGRNRQVRRMCEAIGHPVRRLVRTRIGPLSDRSLAPGAWRELTLDERNQLIAAVGLSSSAHPAPAAAARPDRDSDDIDDIDDTGASPSEPGQRYDPAP
jgi:23S rRNA pseudouridine2605 synthase